MTEHPDFDPAVDRVVRLERDATPREPETFRSPLRVAAQIPLFKAGLLGEEVSVWSRVDGDHGHQPQILEFEAGKPLIFNRNDADVTEGIEFAAAYIYGYVEAVGGDLDQLDVWLETYVPE